MVRVTLPAHLQILASAPREVSLKVTPPVTIAGAVDALEAAYPALVGTVRDRHTRQRRPLVRFFVCEEDWSHEPMDKPLPEKIATGAEPLYIIGAIAGGV